MTDMEAVELIHQRAWVGQKPGLERIRRLLGRLEIGKASCRERV